MILYKTKDGISIEEKPGDIKYYANIIKKVINQYRNLKDPSYSELELIGKKIYNYITTEQFNNSLIPSVGPIWDYKLDLDFYMYAQTNLIIASRLIQFYAIYFQHVSIGQYA